MRSDAMPGSLPPCGSSAGFKQQQRGLLKDKDISRLDVDGHRIKDPARTLAKLGEKIADDPSLQISSPRDVENHIRDIVGVKRAVQIAA